MGNSFFGDLRGGAVNGLLHGLCDTRYLRDEGLDLFEPALGLVHEGELRLLSGDQGREKCDQSGDAHVDGKGGRMKEGIKLINILYIEEGQRSKESSWLVNGGCSGLTLKEVRSMRLAGRNMIH